jgi:PAS domain-containing protein
MSQKPIELILARQLASHLSIPIFVVDAEGTLLFYNEPAEGMLGRRFDEAGEMRLEAWSTMFLPTDEKGGRIPPEGLPLVIAVRERRPVHRVISITGLDGVRKMIEVTAFPLEGPGGRHLGAVAAFWNTDDS